MYGVRACGVLFSAILFLICSCTPDKGSNNLTKEATTYKHFHDGKLQAEFEIQNKQKEGLGKIYYLNGKLYTTCNYKADKKHGTESMYYYDGSVYRTREYTNGRFTGTEKRYYRNGKIKSTLEFKNGMPAIGLKEFSTSGKLKTEYPDFRSEIIYNRDYEHQKLLMFYFSDRRKNVQYYQGKLLEGKYFNNSAIPCGNNSGTGEIALDPDFSGPVTISAKYITSFRAPYIVEKTFMVE